MIWMAISILWLFTDAADGGATTASIATLFAAVASPLCLLITAYLTYRNAQQKNAFDREKTTLENDCKSVKDKCATLQDEVNTLKTQVIAFQVNEKSLINQLRASEEKRDEWRDKYFVCLEDKRSFRRENDRVTKENLQLQGMQSDDEE